MKATGGESGTRRRRRYDGRDQRLALRAIPQFAGCTTKQLERIDYLTVELDLQPGRVLAREGHMADQVIFVIKGRARVTVDGTPIVPLGPGCCIGGTAVLERGRYTGTVTAETPMIVRVAAPHELRSLVTAVPRLAQAAIRQRRVSVRDDQRDEAAATSHATRSALLDAR